MLLILQILYVDRVVFNINTKVPRKQPAFRGWTKEKLKEREVMELEPGGFGSGKILRDATPQQSNQAHKSAEEWVNTLPYLTSLLNFCHNSSLLELCSSNYFLLGHGHCFSHP